MTLPLVVQMTVDSGTTYELSSDTNLQEIDLDNELQINVVGYDVPEYQGSYTVDAGLSPVVLNTQDKRLTQDITVNALPENQVTGNSLTINQDTGKVSSLVSISAGYSPTTFGVNKSLQLSTQARATITPTTSEQTAVAKGKYTTGIVKVGAMPTGTRGTPTATKGSVSNHSVSVTPSVTNTTGYIEGGTVTGTPVSVSASELVSGNKAITSNGNNIDVANYSTVSVNVPNPSTGTINITENGTVDVTDYRSAEVSVSGGVVEEAPDNDVIFIDYDGTRLYSYSAREFANLSALPPNPSHTGLTAQGWNWTLADAKEYVRAHGMHIIGQTYTTSDGKTRIYIRLEEGTPEAYRNMTIRFISSVSNNTTIDWGDGTTETKGTTRTSTRANFTHTYANNGDYVITLTVNSGTIKFVGSSGTGYTIWGSKTNNTSYQNRFKIRKIEIGENVSEIGSYGIGYCNNLKAITIPNTCTITGTEPLYASTLSRGGLVLPTSAVGGSCASCSFKYVSIPKEYSGGSFASNAYLEKICTVKGNPSLGGNSRLRHAIIGDNATNIDLRVFQNDYSLLEITVPSTVTNIASQAFNACYSIREFHFKPTTPPTLRATNAFSSIPSNCVFYVPSESLEAYQTATNWSTYASRMVGE